MTIQKFLEPKKLIQQLGILEHSIVADFGAGLGRYAEEVSKKVGPTGKVFVIDIRKKILDKVKREFEEKGIKNVNFIQTDLEEKKSTGIKDNSVDLVIVASVLFQALKKEEIIKEAVRIIRPNGRILVVEWKACFSGIGPSEEEVFEEEQVLEMMKKYPVRLERNLEAGDYHYAFVFRKIG